MILPEIFKGLKSELKYPNPEIFPNINKLLFVCGKSCTKLVTFKTHLYDLVLKIVLHYFLRILESKFSLI
jgi:hypothetical protein